MSRTFNNVGALAAYFAHLARTTPQAQEAALGEASDFLLKEVKKIPGHYQSDPQWAALAEATVQDRVRKGFAPDDPLRRTGDFAESFKRHVEGPYRAEVGSDDERALWFEQGTKHMPPRPVLGAAKAKHDKDVAAIIGRRMHRHIAGEN